MNRDIRWVSRVLRALERADKANARLNSDEAVKVGDALQARLSSRASNSRLATSSSTSSLTTSP